MGNFIFDSATEKVFYNNAEVPGIYYNGNLVWEATTSGSSNIEWHTIYGAYGDGYTVDLPDFLSNDTALWLYFSDTNRTGFAAKDLMLIKGIDIYNAKAVDLGSDSNFVKLIISLKDQSLRPRFADSTYPTAQEMVNSILFCLHPCNHGYAGPLWRFLLGADQIPYNPDMSALYWETLQEQRIGVIDDDTLFILIPTSTWNGQGSFPPFFHALDELVIFSQDFYSTCLGDGDWMEQCTHSGEFEDYVQNWISEDDYTYNFRQGCDDYKNIEILNQIDDNTVSYLSDCDFADWTYYSYTLNDSFLGAYSVPKFIQWDDLDFVYSPLEGGDFINVSSDAPFATEFCCWHHPNDFSSSSSAYYLLRLVKAYFYSEIANMALEGSLPSNYSFPGFANHPVYQDALKANCSFENVTANFEVGVFNIDFPNGEGFREILHSLGIQEIAIHVRENGILYDPAGGLWISEYDFWNIWLEKVGGEHDDGLFYIYQEPDSHFGRLENLLIGQESTGKYNYPAQTLHLGLNHLSYDYLGLYYLYGNVAPGAPRWNSPYECVWRDLSPYSVDAMFDQLRSYWKNGGKGTIDISPIINSFSNIPLTMVSPMVSVNSGYDFSAPVHKYPWTKNRYLPDISELQRVTEVYSSVPFGGMSDDESDDLLLPNQIYIL